MSCLRLSVQGLSVSVGDRSPRRAVLKDLSFSLEAGRALVLLGPSGSGKSTLLATLLGLLPPGFHVEAGEAWFQDGDERTQLLETVPEAWRRLRGRRIGFLFQESSLALHPAKRIAAQVAEAMDPEHRSASSDQVLELLRSTAQSEPARIARSYPHELSGGERQRVLLAEALARDPTLLLADEPTASLDPILRALVVDVLLARKALGQTLLVVTHDPWVARALGDSILSLEDGRLSPITPRNRPPTTEEVQPKRDVLASTAALIQLDKITVTHRARTFAAVRRAPVPALLELSLDVAPGESVGVLGASGSGKTTLLRTLAGLQRPTSGRVLLRDGQNLHRSARSLQSWQVRVGYVFQDPALSFNPRRTVLDSIGEGLRLRGATRDVTLSEVQRLLAVVGLESSAHRLYPHAFSAGQRQRLAIARALGTTPDLLLADEPLSALDEGNQEQILDLLASLSREAGCALVYVSHDVAAVERLCQKLIVMECGRIVESGTTKDVLSHPSHSATQRLLRAHEPRAAAL